jgi:Flp pilus assembly protein TadG
MLIMIRMLTRFLKAERGAAAIEGAILLPFLAIVYFCLQDFTALITFNRKITLTAATVSDTISQYQTTIARSNITDIFNVIGLIMQPTPTANVRVNVYGYYLNGTAPTVRWQVTNGSGPSCSLPDTTNFQTMMSTSSNDLVVAVTCMNYTPWVATFLGSNLLGGTTMLLQQTIASRPRASATLNCVTVSGGTTACSS